MPRKRTRAFVQRRSTTQDAMGQQQAVWTTLATVSCRLRHKTGRELDLASGEHARADTEVTLYWQQAISDLRPNDRLLVGTRVYDIQHVNNLGDKNRKLILQCTYDPAD